MVLSNKKLKDDLRAKYASISVSKTTDFKTPTNSETPESFKQLLDSTTPKPTLSKREKRRVNFSSLPKKDEIDDTQVEESNEGGKKRKREKKGVEIGGVIEGKIEETGEKDEGKIEETGEVVSERMGIKREKRENDDLGEDIGINVEKGVEKGKKIDGKIERKVKKALENGEVLSERLILKRKLREEKKARKLREKNNKLGVKEGSDMSEEAKDGSDLNKGVKEGSDLNKEVKEGSDLIKEVKEVSDLNKEVNETVKSKKKKKKKKTKKSKKKLEDEKDEKDDKEEKEPEVENGGISEQIVVETREVNEDDKKKVYVGGMPFSSTEDDIWNYFDHCGAITDIDCLKFPDSGKFRGIAIISFKTEEAAGKALALDGSDMEGLYLKIQPYKATRTPKSTTNFIPPVIEGYNRVYTGNLSWDITEDDLRKFFSNCNISSIRFGEDKETGEFKGYAHVDFSDNDSLLKALKLDQMVVCGRPVKISRAVPVKGAPRNPVSGSTPAAVEPQENNGVMATKPTATKPAAHQESNSGIAFVKHQESNSGIAFVNHQENYSVKPQDSYSAIMPVTPLENTGGVSAGKLKRRTCYECGEKGHISSACPKKQATE